MRSYRALQGTPEGSIAIAGNVSDGVCLGSFPLAADGNFQLWVFRCAAYPPRRSLTRLPSAADYEGGTLRHTYAR